MAKSSLHVCFLAIVLLISGTRDVRASLVVIKPVPLDMLVSRSSLIVIARSRPPFVSHEPVTGSEVGTCPPFQATYFSFTVNKVLRNLTDKIPKGLIRVREAYSDVLQAMQAQSCSGQAVPWPELAGYSPSLSWDAEQRQEKDLILFLVERESGWEFTMSGAYESVAKKRAVLAALKKTAAGW